MAFTSRLPTLQRAYRSAADKAVAHVGMSQAMAWPLVMIGRLGDGVRAGALAELLAIEAASLVRPLDQLAEAGLIERREDASDRRAKGLYITAAGQAARDKIESALDELRADIFSAVSDEDLEACLRVFAALDARVGKSSPGPGALAGTPESGS
ncbi:MarR family transcriptional regulator [Xylophilus rhododendri]|uniref:MarR family transcriptional regulator n=2 Tax=Xylophilus rhododendri TaxID=2697032 RepID=A0A857JCX5_9BURK|nr:MarR family transcriptional regulator [Xylophilus rhododendri]